MNNQNQDLSPVVQEMMAQMARMQIELNDLKARANLVTPPAQPVKSSLTTTRRNTLKRLGLALLGGATAATALGAASAVQAKIIANPQGTLANKAGMVVLVPGAPVPAGTPPDFTYGLIASGNNFVFTLGSLPSRNTGVYGVGETGVYGAGTFGVYGAGTVGVSGIGGFLGVHGLALDVHGLFGDYTGSMVPGIQVGVIGNAGPALNLSGFDPNFNIGVYGTASGNTNNYAGFFGAGRVYIGGPLEKPGGSFKIDHPQDPENKYLYHSFVESPDMLNIYNGIVTLNEQGQATVEMPDWFEALNSDFRYQLTCLGQYAPVFVAEEIQERKFKVAGGLAGQRVSWQLSGIRQDQWAKANRIPVEEAKSEAEKGKYLHPEVFGKSEEMGIGPRAVSAKVAVG